MGPLDEIFDLLSEERRRYVLYYLDQQDGPVPVDEVADKVAEWETDPTSASIPDEKLDRIEIELIHKDLPKASEAPYIQYNEKTRMVELTGEPHEFNAIISIAKVIERPDRES